MENFHAAPVVRFYGSDVATAQPTPLEAPPEPAPPEPPLRVVPPRLSAGGPLVALALVAGLAAVALATWAFVSAIRVAEDEPKMTVPAPVAAATTPGVEQALSLLARPTTQRFRVVGSVGRIVLAVTPGNRGYLVVRGLGRAPAGRVYQAWVIPPAGRTIRHGALFRGEKALIPLRVPVREGAAVAITLERAGGAVGPSRTPRLVAVRRS